MGLDMELRYDGELIAEINWLRNPFGLINWATDNVMDNMTDVARPEKTKYTLYEVCNNWTYDNSKNVDREEFLKTVLAYGKSVEAMSEGYFFFDLTGYRNFVQPNLDRMTTKNVFGMTVIDGEKYSIDRRLKVPMSQFQNIKGYSNTTLDDHKKWYRKLVDFAELLQKPSVEFYCSV